jgi:hypothetical protein
MLEVSFRFIRLLPKQGCLPKTNADRDKARAANLSSMLNQNISGVVSSLYAVKTRVNLEPNHICFLSFRGTRHLRSNLQSGVEMDFSHETSLVQVEVDDQGVALVKINRPEKRNALSQQTIDTLISAIALVERDDKVKVVVLTGSKNAGPFSGTCPRDLPSTVSWRQKSPKII